MVSFVLRRLVEAIPVVVLSSFAVFSLLHLIPGDTAQVMAGPDARPEILEAVRRANGLDAPLPLQYLRWIGNAARGDLGQSFITNQPVAQIIGRRFPATLELACTSLALSLLVALPLGIGAALNERRKVDVGVSMYNSLALAVPGFWLGLLAILLFSLNLRWLPPGGRVDFGEDPTLHLKMLILPTVTLALASAAGLSRLVRTSMLEVLYDDFIRTARAKGLAQSVIVARHALRNALVPVVTVLGLQFGRLLGGQVIIEQVFNWPGMGRLIVDSITTRDYVVVQGALLVFVVVYLVINLLVDVSYAVIDPRVRLGGGRSA